MDSGSGPGFDDEPPPEPRDGWLLVRIHVPELNVYKCLQFPSDKLVWDVKQQVLASLPKCEPSFLSFFHPISMNAQKQAREAWPYCAYASLISMRLQVSLTEYVQFSFTVFNPELQTWHLY
ncbi:hypothetical protein GQX74_013360 [Glossina fuscipes]|nr:hypothetical protein GQX74_013360 [Glossina fuscipes]